MSTNVSQRKNATDSESQTVDSRTERALAECMTVLPNHGLARDAPGLFVVIGENENGEYLVDTRTGSCDCDDMRYRDPDAKLLRTSRSNHRRGLTNDVDASMPAVRCTRSHNR